MLMQEFDTGMIQVIYSKAEAIPIIILILE